MAQYVLRLDRVSSVDDVLLNTAWRRAGRAGRRRRWWREPAEVPSAATGPAPVR
nr:hypothetical protein [Micromonospora provocatoris]